MTPMTPQGPQAKSNTVLIIVLAVGGLSLLCCVGTLAAIAVPNFIKFGARSKQAEVKSNLKLAFTAEKSWFAEKDTYSESIEEVGYALERGNRYRYYFSSTGDPLVPGRAPDGRQHTGVAVDPKMGMSSTEASLRAAIPPPLLAELGLHGTCPSACRMTMVAVGNIDADSTMDLWSISTDERTIDGARVAAGTPHHHVDDTRE